VKYTSKKYHLVTILLKGWEIKKSYAAITTPYYHAIIAVPKAWTYSTGAPVTGDIVAIEADSFADMDKGKLQGKIILFDAKLNVERTFKPDAMRYTDSALNEMVNANPQEVRRLV
jgi:carboxypeptidase Q